MTPNPGGGRDPVEHSPLTLRFSAGDEATAPLLWAQYPMWNAMRWFGDEANQFNIKQVIRPPVPVGRDRLLASLRELIETHQTLRTHYLELAGEPRQRVRADGWYTVTVADDRADPDRVGGELADRLAEAVFDHAAEWPLRVACAVDRAGLVTAVALVGSHVGFDGWSFQAFVDLLRDQLRGAAAPVSGAAVTQPLEQVAYQRSPAGRRQNQLGLRHWEEQLASVPASMFDVPRAPTGSHPIERHTLESAAVTAAATALAARTRTSFSSVLLCLTALILTAYNGHDVGVFRSIAGNRLDRRSRGLIALNALDALVTLPVEDDLDLAGAIQRVHRRAFEAYRRAPCDPRDVRRMIERVAHRRGVSLDLSTYFNNGHRGNDWVTASQDLSGARLADLRRGSRYSRLDPLAKSDMKFLVAASDAGGGVCRLGLMIDTAYLPGRLAGTILRGLETLLCDAVTGEVRTREVAARLGIEPVRRGADWVRTPVGWVRPEDVADLVRRAAGGAETAVVAHEDPGTPGLRTLTAYVAGASLSPEALHARAMDLLRDRTGVAAPAGYVVCGAAPDPGSGPAGWRSMPVVARGSGRPGAADAGPVAEKAGDRR